MIGHTNLIEALRELAARGVSPDAPKKLELDLASGRLTCQVLQADSLACALADLRLTLHPARSWSKQDLRRLGTTLAQRVQYLLEPIAPIELDADGVVLQMRSTRPSADEDQSRSYYELLIRREELELRRYRAPGGTPRESIPITLTHEALGRLVGDMDETFVELGPVVSRNDAKHAKDSG
jgi:hypothetical protein